MKRRLLIGGIRSSHCPPVFQNEKNTLRIPRSCISLNIHRWKQTKKEKKKEKKRKRKARTARRVYDRWEKKESCHYLLVVGQRDEHSSSAEVTTPVNSGIVCPATGIVGDNSPRWWQER